MPLKRSLVAFGLLAVSIATIAVASPILRGSASAGDAPSTTTVAVGDTWFCDSSHAGGTCETTIAQGDTVVWDFSGAVLPHSTTECGVSCASPTMTPLWNSGVISDGSSFQFTFSAPGSFLYYCLVHPFSMRGRIVVQGEQPSPTPPPDSPTATPTPTGLATATPTATMPIAATLTPTPPTRPGDVDCGGSVNPIDAALMLQLNAGLLQSLRCPQNGDVNGDGRTNSLDAALVLQFAAGLITHF